MKFDKKIAELELLIERIGADTEDAALFRDLVNAIPLVMYTNRIYDEIRYLKMLNEKEIEDEC